MTPDTWEKVLIGIGGGAVAIFGAWINEWRSERKRNAAKAEAAYLTWLNSYTGILSKLKELAYLAEREPESVEAHELLFEKLDLINTELQGLIVALNTAMLYERKPQKRAVAELHSARYTKLVDILTVVIRHHRLHLRFRVTITSWEELLGTLDGIKESDTTHQTAEMEKQIAKHKRTAQREVNQCVKHLTSCSARLSDDAKGISKMVAEIEQEAPLLRRELAR